MTGDPDLDQLDQLTERIRQAGARREVRLEKAAAGQPLKMSRIGFDFLGAVLGGTLLGWLLDKAVPTLAPWGLIVLIMLGFAGGMMNVWRALASPKAK
jgi:ATP synthase protein I